MDLQLESQRLRELGVSPPTTDSRREIVAALHSKFEGLQSVAAEVLGLWGDDTSKLALRDWLLATFDRKHGWAIRSVAVRELARLMRREDVDWVLNLYFSAPDWLRQHELLPLAAALPNTPAHERVVEKARDASPTVRHAALKILVRSGWGAPADLLRPFAKDSDPEIQRMLRAWDVLSDSGALPWWRLRRR